jgi:hypothetical protein
MNRKQLEKKYALVLDAMEDEKVLLKAYQHIEKALVGVYKRKDTCPETLKSIAKCRAFVIECLAEARCDVIADYKYKTKRRKK